MRHADMEIGKILRELHFDGHCHRWKSDKGENVRGVLVVPDGYRPRSVTPLPRLDDIAYWIRDRFHISIELTHFITNDSWFADSSFMEYCPNFNTLQELVVKSHQMLESEKPEYDYDTALETEIKRILEIIQNNPNLFPNASNDH